MVDPLPNAKPPLVDRTVTMYLAALLGETLCDPGEALTVKSGVAGGFTVKVMLTEFAGA